MFNFISRSIFNVPTVVPRYDITAGEHYAILWILRLKPGKFSFYSTFSIASLSCNS
jgi:hypothetical protein